MYFGAKIATYLLILALGATSDNVPNYEVFGQALLASCTRHFRHERVSDRNFCLCFSRGFVATPANVEAVENAKDVLNDDVRRRLRATADTCLASQSKAVIDAARRWIEDES